MSTITPSRFGAFGEEAFHLPMPGLLADFESGSASIAMTDEFHRLVPDVRARIVQQWLREFRALRDVAVVEMFRARAADRRGLSIVEQIDAFREECEDEGVTCPAELPLLLQRY